MKSDKIRKLYHGAPLRPFGIALTKGHRVHVVENRAGPRKRKR